MSVQRRLDDDLGGYELVVLSPHLDDAALSVGGIVAAAGSRALVVTVCTADAPAEITPFAESLHRAQGGARVAERRAEDRAAMARLGCDFIWADLPDAIYRGYASWPDLFGAPRADDPLRARLAEILSTLPAGAEILAPLAVGGHVDHRLVRQVASARGFARLGFYEDFPYVAQDPHALAQVIGGLSARVVDLSATALAARVAAVAEYASQHAMLTGGTAALLDMLRDHVAEVGGERTWHA